MLKRKRWLQCLELFVHVLCRASPTLNACYERNVPNPPLPWVKLSLLRLVIQLSIMVLKNMDKVLNHIKSKPPLVWVLYALVFLLVVGCACLHAGAWMRFAYGETELVGIWMTHNFRKESQSCLLSAITDYNFLFCFFVFLNIKG